MSGQQEQPPARHQIRVFISSTFRDMHAEREELVKQVFPQLRKVCEQRGVVWGDVDLRWGVTDEQRAEGHALPICLAEIERCRPYFIGLLGERYGPPVYEIHADVLAREPWLNDYREHSLTEIEILHGVLRNPAMAEHAFFYFRDLGYLDRLPKGANPTDFRSATADQVERLRQLKARIRASGFPVRENYSDPKALGQLVLADFTALIDQLYPEGSQPSPLHREAIDQDFYAASRQRAYIRRQNDFDALDRHAAGQGTPLVVLGESGVGKSALLANWALDWRNRNPETPLLLHFIGSTADSADWARMVRRILGEFQTLFGLMLEIPDKPDALRAVFANALNMAGERGRVVLVLDALNQLEDHEGAPDLVWLPPVIPANMRLIVSTLPGRALEDLGRRRWRALTVEPLRLKERRQLIAGYLAQYAKGLSAPRAERIAAAEQTANPLYLRALLEELRLFGGHEQLDQRIGHYLRARNVPELFERILVRWEEDCEGDRPGLVSDALSLIWAARRGLSEAELLDLLGSGGEPMPRAWWSPLSLAAEASLVNRSGLIGFAHDFIRAAVEKRYVTEDFAQHAFHLWLAAYFATGRVDGRTVDELPWQLQQAAAWQRLADLLSGEKFFAVAWAKDQFEVRAYWAQIEAGSALRIAESFRPAIDNPSSSDEHAWRLSILLADTGHREEALAVRAALAEHFRQIGDVNNLAACLGGQAAILREHGDLDKAMELLMEQERICRGLGDKDCLQASLSGQAAILQARGDLDKAMELYKEQERICRELGNKTGLSISRGNQAMILQARGDLDEAMALHKERERMGRELGNKDELAISLGNQAINLRDCGDLDGAMTLLKRQEHICRELGNKAILQASLGNQAMVLQARGDLDEAMALLKEQERTCRDLGNRDGLSNSLGNQALIFQVRGDLDAAMVLHREHESICRELGNRAGLSSSLGNQALILQNGGDLDGAIAMLKEQERICREMENKDGLSRSLGNQALIVLARGESDAGMALLKEQERICRELGNKEGLSTSLGNQAMILKDRGNLDKAMALLKEQERICRELENKYGLAYSLIRQAQVLKRIPDRWMEARCLADEAFHLAVTHGYAALSRQIQTIRESIRGDAS